MCVGVSSSTCEPCVSLAQCVRVETWEQLQSKHENQGLVLEEVLECFTYPNPPLDLNLYSHSLSSFELALLSGICLNVGKNSHGGG